MEESKYYSCLQIGKKKDTGNYKLVSLILIPEEVMEQLILETISKDMKGKNVIAGSQGDLQ